MMAEKLDPSQERRIKVTESNRWFLLNKNIPLFEIIDFFPQDSIGAQRQADNDKLPYEVRRLAIETDEGFTFETDIQPGKFSFRNRLEGVLKWAKRKNLQPGDQICIRKLGDYRYYLCKL